MKHVRTQLTFEPSEARNFEHPVGISETVPDQGLSLRDLIDQQNKGLLPRLNESHYSDEFQPDLGRMDITEVEEMREINAQTISELDDDLKKQGFARRKRK